MPANKALLASSLAVTFASGAFVGHAVPKNQQLPPRQSVEFIYYEHFQDMRSEGYSADEITQARTIYQDYMKSYRRWWDSVLDSMPDTVSAIDDQFHKRMKLLDDSVKLRLEGSGSKKGPEGGPEKAPEQDK